MSATRVKVAGQSKPSHSIRTTDEVWLRARRRSVAEGTTINGVMNELLDGYGRGMINLPTITKSYSGVGTNAVVVEEAPSA
jgi:hypothetical protein